MNSISKLLLTICCAVPMFLPTSVAVAEDVTFEGETIEIIVPFKKGGGTDRWARFWAHRLEEKLPGKPRVVITNISGGGSTKGANTFANREERDGLTLFASSASVMYPFLLGDRRVEYNYEYWDALIVSPTGGIVFASPDMIRPGGNKELTKDKTFRMRVQGPTQIGTILMISMHLLGKKYDVSFGASGATEKIDYFNEGITNIDIQTTPSYLFNIAPLVEDDKAIPVFTLGVLEPDGTIARDSNFPKIPTFGEYFKRQKHRDPKGDLYQVWKQLFVAGFPTQKMLLLHDDVDANIKKAYDVAINNIVEDKEMWPEDYKAILGNYIQHIGPEANVLLEQTLLFKPSVTNWYRDWLEERTGIKI